MGKGGVLLIGICSNSKDVQEDHPTYAYDPAGCLRYLLPSGKAKLLMELRKEAFSLLHRGVRGWRRDYWVGGHPHNAQLNGRGPDLGGSEPRPNYLPSVQLYTGRFFQALGSDRLDLVRRSRRHFLVVSGLYGLVNAVEHIQRYNLDLSDCDQIRRVWASRGALTEVLVGYTTRHKIQVILDLTGLQPYRALVNWQSLEVVAGVEVLHAFCKHNAGDAALPTLGRLAKRLLTMGEMDLLTVPDGYDRISLLPDETVVLTRSEIPPDGFATEDNPPTDLARGCMEEGRMWPEPRPIPVSSGGHGTIFGRSIDKMEDLPTDALRLLQNVSRAKHITGVRFGRFTARGKRPGDYHLKLLRPTPGTGLIRGDLHGGGQLGGIQRVAILVEPDHETPTWLSLFRVDDRIKE